MSNSDNINNVRSSQLPITETNMYVHLLANSEKLVPDDKKWVYNGEKNPELDDDHENYVSREVKHDSHHNNEAPEHFSEKPPQSENNNYTNNHTENNNNNNNTNTEHKLSREELMLQKLDMLRKLCELTQAGVKLSQNYNMNSDYTLMKHEYELHKGLRAKQNGINWMSSMMMNMIYGVEMLNEKYNPFDFKLKGWSEQMNADSNNYFDVFGELYEKYNKPGSSMAVELKILLMISGSALKYHLTNTMMSNLPTMNMNTQLEEDPVLAEQLRQKAIAQKIKEQTINNNQNLNNKMTKEHEIATQKAHDLNMIRQKEIEFQNLKRDNARKSAELEALREKFMTTQTQQNTKINSMTSANINNNQQTMRMSPMVQKLMQARQNNEYESQLLNQYGLGKNTQIPNKLQNIESQTEYLMELEKLKKQKKAQENSDTSSIDNRSNKSSVHYNVDLKNILNETKKDIKDIIDMNSTSEKITSLGIVDKDEISMTNISLGKKKQKQKGSQESEKSEPKKKNVRQKKTKFAIS